MMTFRTIRTVTLAMIAAGLAAFATIASTGCTVGDTDTSPDSAPALACPAPWTTIPWETASDPVRPGHEGEDWIRVHDSELNSFLLWRQAMIACGCDAAPPEIHITQDETDGSYFWWLYGGGDGFAASMDWIRAANHCAE